MKLAILLLSCIVALVSAQSHFTKPPIPILKNGNQLRSSDRTSKKPMRRDLNKLVDSSEDGDIIGNRKDMSLPQFDNGNQLRSSDRTSKKPMRRDLNKLVDSSEDGDNIGNRKDMSSPQFDNDFVETSYSSEIGDNIGNRKDMSSPQFDNEYNLVKNSEKVEKKDDDAIPGSDERKTIAGFSLERIDSVDLSGNPIIGDHYNELNTQETLKSPIAKFIASGGNKISLLQLGRISAAEVIPEASKADGSRMDVAANVWTMDDNEDFQTFKEKLMADLDWRVLREIEARKKLKKINSEKSLGETKSEITNKKDSIIDLKIEFLQKKLAFFKNIQESQDPAADTDIITETQVAKRAEKAVNNADMSWPDFGQPGPKAATHDGNRLAKRQEGLTIKNKADMSWPDYGQPGPKAATFNGNKLVQGPEGLNIKNKADMSWPDFGQPGPKAATHDGNRLAKRQEVLTIKNKADMSWPDFGQPGPKAAAYEGNKLVKGPEGLNINNKADMSWPDYGQPGPKAAAYNEKDLPMHLDVLHFRQRLMSHLSEVKHGLKKYDARTDDFVSKIIKRNRIPKNNLIMKIKFLEQKLAELKNEKSMTDKKEMIAFSKKSKSNSNINNGNIFNFPN